MCEDNEERNVTHVSGPINQELCDRYWEKELRKEKNVINFFQVLVGMRSGGLKSPDMSFQNINVQNV